MLYIFGFLSVLSPTIFLQSRLLDSPLTPATGVQESCLGSVCLVSPRPGTSLKQFIKAIPPSDIPVINPGPQVRIPDAVLGDDDDGGGRGGGGRGGRWEIAGQAYAAPFYLAQKVTPPNAKMLSSVMVPSKDRIIRKNNTNRGSIGHITFSGLPSSTPRPLALLQCLRLDKARHLQNETCAYPISGNEPPVLLPSLVDSRPLDQHRCLLTDKAFHLVNETCSATISSPLPSIKVIVDSLLVPQRRCSISDKAFHLLNDTCVLNPVERTVGAKKLIDLRQQRPRCLISDKALHLLNNTCVTRPSKRMVAAELPTFEAAPYRPISIFSLPCLSSGEARRGAPQSCGHNAVPNLTTALDWDITAQAALLSAQVVDQTPAFLDTPIDAENLTSRRHRGSSLVAAGPVASPISIRCRYTSVFESSQLQSIRLAHIIVAIVSVLGCIFRGMEQTGQLTRLDDVSKVEEPLTEGILVETVKLVVPEDDAPPPTAPKTKSSPAKAKCRIVGGKRVQPLQGRRTPTPPQAEGASSSRSTAKKSRKAKAPQP